LLPFLLFLVLVWGVAGGDVVLLPVAVGVGSLIVQTHLSYVVLVPGLLLSSLAALILVRRRTGAPVEAGSRPPMPLRRGLVVAGVVGLVLWAQPLAEQVTGPGEGNLTRLATTRGGDDERAGPMLGSRLVAGVHAVPPLWFRPSYGGTYSVPLERPDPSEAEASASGLPSPRVAATGLVGLGVALAAAGVLSWRRRRRVAAMALAVTLALEGLVLLTAAIQPFNPVLGLAGHQVAWLWPAGAFALSAVLGGLIRSPRVAVVGGAVAVGVFAILALPTENARVGPRRYDDSIPSMRALGEQLDVLAGGTYLLDLRNLYFGEPYSTSTMLELVRRGSDFRVAEEGLVRQAGEGRRFDGDADGRLYLEIGARARSAPPSGGERIAFVEGLDGLNRAALADARAEVLRIVASDGVRLSTEGAAALRRGDLPVLADVGPRASEALMASGELGVLVRSGYVDRAQAAGILTRWADLQHRDDTLTVALFLAPLADPPPPSA
ncbi:MAG: hypothetical protein ABIP36_08630, partial [Acidimicrobiales bacterium]